MCHTVDLQYTNLKLLQKCTNGCGIEREDHINFRNITEDGYLLTLNTVWVGN